MADSKFGGYACHFVEEIPKELQTECSICLQVLRDPQIVDCCGYRFCKSCIEMHLSKSSNYCPMCKHQYPNTFADKQLTRTLRQKKVRCTHKENGCEWTGELSELDGHLDITKRIEGCTFKTLACVYCNMSLKRSEIENHEMRCLQKPLRCEFCDDFECLRHEMDQHWEDCDLYPIACPKGCGVIITRLGLDEHYRDICSHTIVKCEFAYAGCEVKIPRKSLRDHMQQSMENHLTLLTKKYLKLEVEYKAEQKRTEELDLELQQAYEEQNKIGVAKDEKIISLKKLCALRAEEEFSDASDQVLVENLPNEATELKVKSLFGQYGRLYAVKVYYSWTGCTAVIEYKNSDSIDKLFHQYHSKGIRLLKTELKCTCLRC